MNKTTLIQNSSKSIERVDLDNFIKLQINNTSNLLPVNEINRIINLEEQFNIERNNCNSYRIFGTITPLMTNVLFNQTGFDSWESFNNDIFIKNSNLSNDDNITYSESILKHLRVNNGWYGYYSPEKDNTGSCSFNDMEPKRERFTFTTDQIHGGIKNWELTLTYPYSSDTTHNLISGGLLLVESSSVIVGGRTMIAVTTPVYHNLTVGNIVRLIGTSNDGDYEIKRLGLDNGDLINHVFCIDIDNLSVNLNSRFTKLYDGVESKYYFRLFKKIDMVDDNYEINNLSFSKNIFTDNITQFVFNNDINISGLTDNLNRPLSELFLTCIKTNSDGVFSKISSGIECDTINIINSGNTIPYIKSIPIIHKIHTAAVFPNDSNIPLESDITINNDIFYGDIVEYNIMTINEVVLSSIQHRFNTINRDTTSSVLTPNNRPEGVYYNAHERIRLRAFSSYIETGNDGTIDKPEYSVNLGDGRYIWRDLLPIGVNDVASNLVNYPFVNNNHYIHQNYCIKLKRQDQFNNWGLYHSTFPADPFGIRLKNNFNVNLNNNVC